MSTSIMAAMKDRIVWLLLVAGVLLPIVDLAAIAFFAAQHRDYSHVRQLMSELGETERPWSSWTNAWFTTSSMLLVGFGFAMAASLPRTTAARTAAILFLGWAFLGIVAG